MRTMIAVLTLLLASSASAQTVESGGANYMPSLRLTCPTCTAVMMGGIDLRGSLSNAGAANGGSLMVADSLRLGLTGTNLIESATVATGGVDTALLIKPLNALDAADNVFAFQRADASNLLFCKQDTTCGFSGPVYSSAFRSDSVRSNTGAMTIGGTNGAAGVAGYGTTITTGSGGTGGDFASGNLTIDTGTPSGAGTAGSITIGATNASGLTLGRSGITTYSVGNIGITSGTLSLGSGINNGTVSAATAGPGVAGKTLTISGGNGGTGDTAGGHLYLRGGAKSGTGANGNVYLGDSNTTLVQIGASGVGTFVGSLLEVGTDLRLGKSATTCTDATNRGRCHRTEGGAGVADTVECCLKDAADTYGWRTVFP